MGGGGGHEKDQEPYKGRVNQNTAYIIFCLMSVLNTDLNYWIKLLSCIIEANGGHIGLSHINLHWCY